MKTMIKIACFWLVLCVPACDFMKNSSGDNLKSAKKGVEQFINDNKWTNATFSCSPEDTDGDGYLSCSVFREGKNPIQLDCLGHRYLSQKSYGCKLVNTRTFEINTGME